MVKQCKYGSGAFIYKAAKHLLKFDGNHALSGSWLVDDKTVSISNR